MNIVRPIHNLEMLRLAIAGSDKTPLPPVDLPILQDALAKIDIETTVQSWDKPGADWQTADSVLIGPTWDYHENHENFVAWVEQTSAQNKFFNPSNLVIWNSKKTYLTDLEVGGAPIIPTLQIRKGSPFRLKSIFEALSAEKVVIKPQVGASAIHTHVITAADEDLYQSLKQEHAMLAQPYVESIEDRGEVSLTMFNGKFSHSILKTAAPGDFRIQQEHGGQIVDYEATERERELADMLMFMLPTTPLYARVDFVNINGEPKLMELELIEPDLHLRYDKGSADRFARAIKLRMEH